MCPNLTGNTGYNLAKWPTASASGWRGRHGNVTTASLLFAMFRLVFPAFLLLLLLLLLQLHLLLIGLLPLLYFLFLLPFILLSYFSSLFFYSFSLHPLSPYFGGASISST
jgi:hypothetical protein